MNSDLIRALTPGFLAICSVSIFAIAVFGRLSENAFTQTLAVVGTGLGGAAGASMSGGSRVSAKEIENVDLGSGRNS